MSIAAPSMVGERMDIPCPRSRGQRDGSDLKSALARNLRSRRRFGLVLAVLAALGLVTEGCGGGSSSGGGGGNPPPPPAKFSNATLSGKYAFSMSGTEDCGTGGTVSASSFARIGSFTADGNGRITTGLEDINSCSGAEIIDFTGGSYSIDADGRGSMSLINSSGTTTYSIVLSTASQGNIVQTDAAATASGNFQRQTASAFSTAAIAGGYVFDFKGVDVDATATTASAASIIGRFDANGGGITNGLFDSNIAGVLSGQQVFPAGAFYAVDANSDGTNFGRGTANIGGRNYAFYVVDATRLKMIVSDFPSLLVGDAFAQQNVAFNVGSLSGGFAFLLGGTSTTGSIATAGRFTADGGGNLTDVIIDENNAGGITQLPNGTVTGTYTVDTNTFGGGTLTWTDTTSGTFTFIFYLISPTQAVFQETDNTITSDGSFFAQTTSPITTASLAGDYALDWSGTRTDEEDYIGQFTLTSGAGNFTGLLDLNEFTTGVQTFDASVSGNLALDGNGAGANTFTANVGTAPPRALAFTAYVVNTNTFFVVGIDTNRVVAGSGVRQP